MSTRRIALGLGIGWRPPIASFVASRLEGRNGPPVRFVEVTAENVDLQAIPSALDQLLEQEVTIVPHGLSLSLGGSDSPDPARLDRLAALAQRLRSPLISEHIAFVRAGGQDAGHLLPVPRTSAMLDVLAENVRVAQESLPVPLALEHVAALFEWPDAEMDETTFLCELVDRTGVFLLLDVANLYANAFNHGFDAVAWLERTPLDRVAYVHVGGGVERDGIYHDTHGHAVVRGVLDLVEELCARAEPPGVMLERDDHFPSAAELAAELDAIDLAVRRGSERRLEVRSPHIPPTASASA